MSVSVGSKIRAPWGNRRPAIVTQLDTATIASGQSFIGGNNIAFGVTFDNPPRVFIQLYGPYSHVAIISAISTTSVTYRLATSNGANASSAQLSTVLVLAVATSGEYA